jgi:hypothetical protein
MTLVVFLILLTAETARAQTPTGTIAGMATDAAAAAVPDASIRISNVETGHIRTVITSGDGRFSAEALPAGIYRITIELPGFKLLQQTANVATGTTTTVDLVLVPGDVNETVTVSGALPLRYEHHQVAGLISRAQIENLPLNGRNFLELAKLEPGVTAPVRLADNRTFVSVLGSGTQTIPRVGYTRVTVDGASVTTPSTIGQLLQVSQDVVQEFQLSTANFDAATSLTTNGAINIVTRSGGNQYHGSAFAFYRDHNLAAYPAPRRNPTNRDPFFRRIQSGAYAGGPILKNRAFFFTSYERHDQTSVVSIQPGPAEFEPLSGIFSSPYTGNLFSARVDLAVGARHTVFARFTHDGNRTFAPTGPPNSVPSGWSVRTVDAHQTLIAVTSVLPGNVVNDVRASYFPVSTPSTPPGRAECGNCFALGAPRIAFTGNEVTLGSAGVVDFVARRLEVTDHFVWRRGAHRVGAGFDWEHSTSQASLLDREPAQVTLWSPAQVRQLAPTIPLPASFTTVDDFLQLPLRSFQTAVGPGFIPQRNFAPQRVQDLYRVYASDTWNAGSRLTLNGGLSWSYEPNALNDDLTKPSLLSPILGSGKLSAQAVQRGNLSAPMGFAWKATDDGGTVVRGGVGRYFDPVASTNRPNLDNERLALSPLGTGRLIRSGANLVCDGRTLDFRQPTTFTGAQLLACLPAIRAELMQSISPGNRDFPYGISISPRKGAICTIRHMRRRRLFTSPPACSTSSGRA